MLTILLLATLVVFAITIACTVGAVASIGLLLFGDVLLAMLIAVGIVKIHKHFKNKKKNDKKK